LSIDLPLFSIFQYVPIQIVIFHRFFYVYQVKLPETLPGPSGQRTIGEGQSQIQGGRSAAPWEMQIILLDLDVGYPPKKSGLVMINYG
jgi:hypothetical protein